MVIVIVKVIIIAIVLADQRDVILSLKQKLQFRNPFLQKLKWW